MALSTKAKKALEVAIANNDESAEVIAELEKISAAGDITVIADPATATAEDVANKVNEVIAALS